MRAKFINEIKQDREESGLGSIGIGKLALTNGYKYVMQYEKILGSSLYDMTYDHDTSTPLWYKGIRFLANKLNCTTDDLKSLNRISVPYGLSDSVDLIDWLKDKLNHMPEILDENNEFEPRVSNEQVQVYFSKEWNMGFVHYIKTSKRAGETCNYEHFFFRYK
jgi:hypothetical protein